jgi:6-phosphofructokinase 1
MKGFTILVADNDPDYRESLAASVLEPEGFQVHQAASPEQAQQLLQKYLIHLAILDVRLENDDDPHDMSGLALCKAIDPVVARILLTAYPPGGLDIGTYPVKTHIPCNGRTMEVYMLTKQEGPGIVLEAVKESLEERFEISPHQRIAVLTSGGDSPGMNAALRSIVRVAMDNGVEVFGAENGFQGLVDDQMYRLTWHSVSDILVQGGTILGAGRCQQFRAKASRRRAIDNLLCKQISGLIIIGGDGSIRAAMALEKDLAQVEGDIQTVIIPGTIDNDILGTDMSLGAASAANAMIEQMRNMIRPAQAMRRVFVCEVSGRYSGYLALMAALGIGADAVITPEQVIAVGAWGKGQPRLWEARVKHDETEVRFQARLDEVADVLEAAFAAGKQYGFVVLSEGIGQLTGALLDRHYARRHLEERIKQWSTPNRPEVREHILGHPVRGVSPCHFDVWLGAALGAEAVRCLLLSEQNVMVGWSEREGIITRRLGYVVRRSNRPPGAKWRDRPKWQEWLELQQALASPPSLQQQLKERGNRFTWHI